MRSIIRLTVLAAFFAVPTVASGQEMTPDSWREDLKVIAHELPKVHPDLFYRMSRATWDSAITAVDRRLPTLNRHQAIVALMELVALPRDGHTSIHPMFDPALRIRYYPLELRAFEDGVFVTAAAPAYARCLGARVTGIGKVGIEEAMAAVARIVPSENEWWTRAWSPSRLMMPELLAGLGLVADMENLPLRFEKAGKGETMTVKPAGWIEPRGHDPRGGIDRSGWLEMRQGAAPTWQKNPGMPYWVEYLNSDRTLYVGYRAVISLDHGEPSDAFWRRVFALADSLPVDRFVLDLRENGGGNNFLNRQVVRGLIRRPSLDRADRLFVVVGGRTFSAAMNLALDLEKWTGATFVGEPTGNATFFFGDHRQIVLPKSGITVNVSTLPWRPYDPRDRRVFLAPKVYVPMSSSAYAKGQDPVMEAILALGSQPDFIAAMETAVLRGDSASAEAAFDRARKSVANRFRSFEADVNRLGYSLLNARHTAAALVVFRMNTRAYPRSANTWDSLGEALAVSGMKEQAIVAYRQALAVDPEFRASREALARLQGAHE